MSAATAPISTLTGSSGAGSGTTASLPSTPPGLVCPSPVAKITTTDPLRAGLAAELTVPSSFRMAPCPVPDPFAVNIPGALGVTDIVTGGEAMPAYSTNTATEVLAATEYGTTTLSCLFHVKI